jgi:hypothetical protein
LFRQFDVFGSTHSEVLDKVLSLHDLVIVRAKPAVLNPVAAFLMQPMEANVLIFDGRIDFDGIATSPNDTTPELIAIYSG